MSATFCLLHEIASCSNVDFYYDVKDPVCDSIMAGAEDWATATGWRVEHYS